MRFRDGGVAWAERIGCVVIICERRDVGRGCSVDM